LSKPDRGKIGLQVNVLHASVDSDFDVAFATAVESRIGGVVISDDEFFSSRSGELAALALRRAVRTIFQHREFVAAGGLMSYGSSRGETYHQVGGYAGLILKGAAAAGLQVYQSTSVDLTINMKTR
jgi:putative ABC transport system substrate-binding protein